MVKRRRGSMKCIILVLSCWRGGNTDLLGVALVILDCDEATTWLLLCFDGVVAVGSDC